MKADTDDYNSILKKFLSFIFGCEIINDYLSDCGSPTFDVSAETKEIMGSYGRMIYNIGDTEQEENANILAILENILEKNINIDYGLVWGYSSSSKRQDKVKGFNDRVVFVLIQNIERYLTKIGIDMGMDENTKYSITVNNGQVNLASDNSTINATVNNGINYSELQSLLNTARAESEKLSSEDAAAVHETLDTVQAELSHEKPKKGLLMTILTGLRAIKGTVEFAAAIAALMQFIQQIP